MGRIAAQSTDMNGQSPPLGLADPGRLDSAWAIGKATIRSCCNTALVCQGVYALSERTPVQHLSAFLPLDAGTSTEITNTIALVAGASAFNISVTSVRVGDSAHGRVVEFVGQTHSRDGRTSLETQTQAWHGTRLAPAGRATLSSAFRIGLVNRCLRIWTRSLTRSTRVSLRLTPQSRATVPPCGF